MTITIQGQLATLNEHDNANRSNRFMGAKLKKEMTELVQWQAKKYKTIEHPCTLTFHWHYSGRHDFDNIRFGAKFLQDGLVKAGVLKDDSQKYVIGYEGDHFIKVAKGQEKVVVEVHEYPEQ